MDKKEFQQIVKHKLKDRGFRAKGNYHYIIINSRYWAGIKLDHHPYCRGYYIEYGGIYDPANDFSPFHFGFDLSYRFVFSKKPNDDLGRYDISNPIIENIYKPDCPFTEYFEYETRTKDDLVNSLVANLDLRFPLFCNDTFILEQYRKDWILFRLVPEETVGKIARLLGLEMEDVMAIRDSNIKKWPPD